MANSADPDQLASSHCLHRQSISVSAGLGLKTWKMNANFIDLFYPKYSDLYTKQAVYPQNKRRW